jgi:hypothetical protein
MKRIRGGRISGYGIRDTGFVPCLGILDGTVDSQKLKVKCKEAFPAAILTLQLLTFDPQHPPVTEVIALINPLLYPVTV